MGLLTHYQHIINPKLKHIYLSFDAEGNLLVKSPKVSPSHIEKLLLKKSAWINRSREKIAQKKRNMIDPSASTLFFLGDPFPLTLIQHQKKKTKLSFDETQFTLFYHTYDETLFHAHIDRFYKIQAQKHIPPLVEHWSKKMSLHPAQIGFRKTKKQWGSCSSKNVLSFNTMVMKLPEDVIQYIIVHELAHIAHKHHKKPFWDLVEDHLPYYKEHVATLKHYTT
ncbi:MAG: hypothetical protein RL113_907 [Pseudomonadota bacterium]|jgi:predicted metal-dependent hydrolase